MTDDDVKLIRRLHELANCLEADPAFNPLTNMEYVSALRDAAVAIVQANSSSPDELKAAQQIVDVLAAIKGKKLAIAFRDEATAQHVGMIIENAAKVSRALLNRPNSSSKRARGTT